MKKRRLIALVVTVLTLIFSVSAIVRAHHAWVYFGYELHWPGSSSQINLELVDYTSNTWNSYVRRAARDWTVADNVNVNYNRSGSCSLTSQCIEVIADDFGPSGWLGLGGGNVEYDPVTDQLHWYIGVAIMNDYYYETEPYASFYGTPDWRGTVMCQEIGHALGLTHIDEDFSTNIASCMDYASIPYPHPFAHDIEVLEDIHDHQEEFVPPAAPPIMPPGLLEGNFGSAVRTNNGVTMYVRETGENSYFVSFVTFVDADGAHSH